MGFPHAPLSNILHKKLSNMLNAKLSIEESRKLGMLESGRAPHGEASEGCVRVDCEAIACGNGKWCWEKHHCRNAALLLQLFVAMQHGVECMWDGALSITQCSLGGASVGACPRCIRAPWVSRQVARK